MELKEFLVVGFYNNDKKENCPNNTVLYQFLLDNFEIELSCVLGGPKGHLKLNLCRRKQKIV